MARDRLDDSDARIAPYRAGYTPQQRREIERDLATGQLTGVVATNALELGIDIGHLDAAIAVTFPGTVASLRQQWGRAGRTSRGGLALYVAGDDALDQFFCRHPDEFLERAVEAAILDHSSETIWMRHLVAAAHEGPLERSDAAILGEGFEKYADRLVASGDLRRRGDRWLPRGSGYPAARVSLRSASPDSFTVVDDQKRRADRLRRSRARLFHDPSRRRLPAPRRALRGGRARHRRPPRAGAPLRRRAITRSRRSRPRPSSRRRARSATALGVPLRFGIVSVAEQVIAYQRKSLADHEVIDLHPLDLPEQNFVTQALWYELGDEHRRWPPARCAARRAARLRALADRRAAADRDVRPLGHRRPVHQLSTTRPAGPTIFIYDGHPGGVGITRRGFEVFERLVADANRLVGECPCEAGCPSCVQSPKCGNLNEPLSKQGALDLMGAMLARG